MDASQDGLHQVDVVCVISELYRGTGVLIVPLIYHVVLNYLEIIMDRFKSVLLKPITEENWLACIALKVSDDQKNFVAENSVSIAQAYVKNSLHPYGIYQADAHSKIDPPMLGFTLFDIGHGIGFILRLMVDIKYQGRGVGHAAMKEAIRRLKLNSEVQYIATSHQKDNHTANALYTGLGFIDWETEWPHHPKNERYLILRE